MQNSINKTVSILDPVPLSNEMDELETKGRKTVLLFFPIR